MNFEHRLRIESALAVRASGAEEVRVESFEVFDAQSTKWDVSEPRDDMELEYTRVAVPSTRPKI